MSDPTTAVYMLMTGIYLVVTSWKTLAFLRGPTVTLALITSAFFVGGVVYAMASPAGYRFLGEQFGQPRIATLPIYIGILYCYAVTHILTLLWTPARNAPRWKIRRTVGLWTGAYGMAIVAMTVTFLNADLDGPADPLRFNTQQADDPYVQVFLAILLLTLACGTLSTWQRARRAESTNPQVRHALRWFGGSMLVTFGYVLCSAPAIFLAAVRHPELETLGVFGSYFGILGCLGTCYGMTGAAFSAWLRERRDSAALQPLWKLVVGDVDTGLMYSAAIGKPHLWGAVRVVLTRRIIEILDGIWTVRPWARAEIAQAVYELEDGTLSPHELEAVITAAVLRDAVARYRGSPEATRSEGAQLRAAPSGQAAGVLPGQGTAAQDERARLVRVARALQHPLVDAALERAAATCAAAAESAVEEPAAGHR
ncbi:MAB_1171c family putative transporter [Streptomyces roseolus]|uniref:MAB_1171c family putative transporter n=1 Tax=Streptomyces roseolus TaxID=67358 RepID=UPI003793CD0F